MVSRRMAVTGASAGPEGGRGETSTAAKAKKESAEEAICDACGGLGAFLRCGRCKSARYCTPYCQKRHWPRHKGVCRKGGTVLSLGAQGVAAPAFGVASTSGYFAASKRPAKGSEAWAAKATLDAPAVP